MIMIIIFNGPNEILILLFLLQLTILYIKLNNLINNKFKLLNLMNMTLDTTLIITNFQ
jgi:hypothetical protein